MPVRLDRQPGSHGYLASSWTYFSPGKILIKQGDAGVRRGHATALPGLQLGRGVQALERVGVVAGAGR